MKLILLLAVACLALHNGKGAPRTAVYKFVRCNPEGGKANCVTQQSAEMEWSPDLPAKLPASTAQYLEAEPVEDENLQGGEEEEEQMDEEYTEMISEEGESPVTFSYEEGSGGYEGSAFDVLMADRSATAESETGSGESWTVTDNDKGEDMWQSRHKRSLADEAKPAEQELRDDHLLQL
ncbi:serglycin [Lates calcarifer]|uniref:Serglycin n=1 Tax=Lates calcarifer TaxID=8187 RepID=A0AAJ7PG02_LATCA|nr:serglycin [Lates calcarifer]